MKSFRASSLTLFVPALLLTAATTLQAQLPRDSGTWKARCTLLSNNAANIQAGKTPAGLVAATRGIPGQDFYTMAVDRSEAGERYVACTYFYAAAIAYRAGNGGNHDYKSSYNDTVLAAAEVRLAHHQHLTMTQHAKRIEAKAQNFGKTLTLNGDASQKVQDAGSTFPITLDTANDPLLTPVASTR